MKKHFSWIILLGVFSTIALGAGAKLEEDIRARSALHVGSWSSISPSAIFEVSSTIKGSRPAPAMTQAQRDAISSPIAGLQIYNTTSSRFNFWDGDSWEEIGSGLAITALTGDVTATGPGSAISTLAPITNAKISAAAGIGVTKLEALTASRPVVTNGSGFLSTPSAYLSGALGGTGMDTSLSQGILKFTVGTPSVGQIVNSDVSAAAGIGVTKLQALTANQLVHTDSSGFLRSSGALELQEQAVTPTTPTSGWTKFFTFIGVYDLFSRNDQGYVERIRPEATIKNVLENPGFDKGTTGWSATNGVLAAVGIGTTGYQKIGPASGTWDSSGLGSLTGPAYTIGTGLAGTNGRVACRVIAPSGTATFSFAGSDGGGNLINPVDVTVGATAQVVETSFVFGAAGTTIAPTFVTLSNQPLISIDDCYIGPNENIGTVQQASFYGGGKWVATTSCNWSRSSATWASYSADSDCTSPSGSNLYGYAVAPSTKIPAITFNNLPPGEYLVKAQGSLYSANSTASTCFWRVTDGSTSTSYQVPKPAAVHNSAAIEGRFAYTTTQSSVTFEIQARADSAVACDVNNGTTDGDLVFLVYRFPAASEVAVRANALSMPTQQKFLSGSGTYTRPNGVTYIRVRMVGGGGGGGTGTVGTAGGNGGNTTFGTSLLVANGGSGGSAGGGAITPGGSASLGTGPIGVALTGGSGTSALTLTSGAGYGSGGAGAASPFGGAGGGGANAVGGTAVANTGSGGGGGGTGNITGAGGVGGAAGGYVDAIIASPASTYSYAVGSGGAGGTPPAANGYNGGAGGSGLIIVEEYYGTNAPVFIGSVTSSSAGAERIERAYVGSSSCSSSPCTLTSSTPGISSITRSATGTYAINFASGTFSAIPSCQLLLNNAGGVNMMAVIDNSTVPTSSAVTFLSLKRSDGSPADSSFMVTCTGPR